MAAAIISKDGSDKQSNKQWWNNNNCICECKELIDKEMWGKGFIWNSNHCECICGKSCDIGEYLEYKNCKCWKTLVDWLVEECSENIDGNEMIDNGTSNDYQKI